MFLRAFGLVSGVASLIVACGTTGERTEAPPRADTPTLATRAGDASVNDGSPSEAGPPSVLSPPPSKFPERSPLKWSRLATTGTPPKRVQCIAGTADGAVHVFDGAHIFTLAGGAWSASPLLTTNKVGIPVCGFDARSNAHAMIIGDSFAVGDTVASPAALTQLQYLAGQWKAVGSAQVNLNREYLVQFSPLSPNSWAMLTGRNDPRDAVLSLDHVYALYNVLSTSLGSPVLLRAGDPKVNMALLDAWDGTSLGASAKLDSASGTQGPWVLQPVTAGTGQPTIPSGAIGTRLGSVFYSQVLQTYVEYLSGGFNEKIFGIAAISPTTISWQQSLEPNLDLRTLLGFAENTGSSTLTALSSSDSGTAVIIGTVQSDEGAKCTVSDGCLSGNCVDGVCCETACNGDCEACTSGLKLSNTGTGKCGIAKAASDSTCPQSLAAVCKNDKSQLFIGDKFAANCAPYACQADACLAACTTVGDCATGYACNGTGTCIPQASAADGGGGGCNAAPQTDRASWAFGVVLALVAGLASRRQRKN